MRKLTYQEIFEMRPKLEDLENLERLPFFCLVENIRSLWNVGSIFRTSDAVRLKQLYLTGFTGYPPRKEIDKTALGAAECVPWKHFTDPFNAVYEMRNQDIQLIALEHTSESISYMEFDYKFPCCLMLGNEVDGLSEKLIAEADAAIEIPMFGLKQSLNVAVAYGVVMFHILYRFLEMNKKDK